MKFPSITGLAAIGLLLSNSAAASACRRGKPSSSSVSLLSSVSSASSSASPIPSDPPPICGTNIVTNGNFAGLTMDGWTSSEGLGNSHNFANNYCDATVPICADLMFTNANGGTQNQSIKLFLVTRDTSTEKKEDMIL